MRNMLSGLKWFRRLAKSASGGLIVGVLAASIFFAAPAFQPQPAQAGILASLIQAYKESYIAKVAGEISSSLESISALAAGFAMVKEAFDFLFGGIDGLNTQMTNLFKLQTDAQTKLMQANIDARGQMEQARTYAQTAMMKLTSTAQVEQWCYMVQANRVADELDLYRDAGLRYLVGHDYAYGTENGILTSPCLNVGAGHADSTGKTRGCDSTQSAVDTLKVGCAIGALDQNDVKNTTISKTSCSTAVAKAFNIVQAPGSDPEVIYMNSIFLPPGETPTTGGASDKYAPGIRENLFQIQMYYCHQLRGNVPNSAVGKEISTMAGASAASQSMTFEARHRNREQLCLDTVMDHAGVPCNGKAKDGFTNICTELVKTCTDAAQLMDVSIYPGCYDGSGSISPADVREIKSRICANAQASVNTATSPGATPDQVLRQLEACTHDSAMERSMERMKKLMIQDALLRGN